jgi:iron complex outermembrane receptor protein
MHNSAARFSFSILTLGFECLIKFSVFSLFMISAVLTRAQVQPDSGIGVVEGRVSSQLTKAYLPNARVTVEGGTQEAITDGNGSYRLTGVPAGPQRVTTHYVGLASVTGTVNVVAGHATTLDFELDRSNGQTSTEEGKTLVMEKFEVLSDREESAQQRAMNQQRQSPNIKNVVAYDEFPTPGDDNIGDYMRYIPGLSVIYSGRAATDAQIRGLPSDTSSITVDGLALSGAFSGSSRSVSLLSVPTANIATIEVTKVPTPDMPAHGLGGSINITTKSGFERTKPLFTYDLFTSFDPDLGFDKRAVPDDFINSRPVRPSFRASYVYPVNKSLSISLNASQQNTYSEPRTGVVTYDLVRALPSSISMAAGYQSVTVNTARLGVDWKLGTRNIFGASYSFREREAQQATPTLTATFGANATGNATSAQGAAGAVGTLTDAGTWESLSNDTRQTDFKYKYLGTDWRVDFGASYSTSGFYFLPQLEEGYLGASKTVSTAGVTRINATGINSLADTAEEMLGTLTAFTRAGAPFAFNNAGGYSVTTVGARDYSNEIAKGQLRLDARRDFNTAMPFTLRTGLAWSSEVQEVADRSNSYAFRSGQTAAVRQASNYDVINTAFSTPDVFGASQTWTSGSKLYDLLQSNPEYFTLNEAAAWQTRVAASKEFEEEISAAYLRLDTYLLQKRLWLVGGVRYERTEDYGEGPLVDPTAQYVRNVDGSLARTPTGALIPITTNALEVAKLVYTERGTRKKTTYDGFFPSFNATYHLTKDLLLRAGYARTIGRPNLPFIIPGITYGTVSPITNTQTITVVNTALKPWTADNIDLSLESYMFKGGFGSLGVFQKDISNFFLATSEEGTPERLAEYGIFPGEGNEIFYSIVTRANGGDARVRGFEFSYRQNLFFMPKWAAGIQVFVNYTRSELDGSNTADFTGFNPETLSYGVSLTRKRFVVKFNATEQGETKRTAVAQSATIPAGVYQYQGELRRYVLSGEFRINQRLSVYGQWGDFNNPNGYVDVQKRYNDSTPEVLRGFRVATWGQSVVVGVKGSF